MTHFVVWLINPPKGGESAVTEDKVFCKGHFTSVLPRSWRGASDLPAFSLLCPLFTDEFIPKAVLEPTHASKRCGACHGRMPPPALLKEREHRLQQHRFAVSSTQTRGIRTGPYGQSR